VHRLSNCPEYLNFPSEKRVKVLKKARLCLNCMKPGHFIKNCKGGSYKRCAEKHNTLIHFEERPSKKNTEEEEGNNSSSVLCSHNRTVDHCVLLSTAVVLIEDSQGKYHKARAILDPGS